MARTANRLSARKVETEKRPGRYCDGNGLNLQVTSATSRSWVFVFHWRGKRREMGLGSTNAVDLPTAREKALTARKALADGKDPFLARDAVDKAPVTFKAYADQVVPVWQAGLKNKAHRRQWDLTIDEYCKPLHDLPIGEITSENLLSIIRPIWLSKHETANRVRAKVEKVLSAARATGVIQPPYENPARLKGHLEHLLPHFDATKRTHFAALPYADAPDFMARLRTRHPYLANVALEFTILTCVRSHMTRSADWSEVFGEKTDEPLWIIPKGKMKMGAEHIVPLTPRMLELMGKRRKGLIFPGLKGEMSDATLERPLDRMGYKVTVHGFRSTFKDWASNCTAFADEVSEEALAHTVGSATRRAYRREAAIDKRRALLTAWGEFLSGE